MTGWTIDGDYIVVDPFPLKPRWKGVPGLDGAITTHYDMWCPPQIQKKRISIQQFYAPTAGGSIHGI